MRISARAAKGIPASDATRVRKVSRNILKKGETPSRSYVFRSTGGLHDSRVSIVYLDYDSCLASPLYDHKASSGKVYLLCVREALRKLRNRLLDNLGSENLCISRLVRAKRLKSLLHCSPHMLGLRPSWHMYRQHEKRKPTVFKVIPP